MAVGTDSSNPRSYELEILTIVNNEGDGFDIRDIMVECNIYESIHRNFLMGELIISDAIGFYENAKLFGSKGKIISKFIKLTDKIFQAGSN